MKEEWGEKAWWRDCEKGRERWWREQGGRNQSASHYLLSGALQQTDEIIKNPIAALWEGMTGRREIHSWTGQSNRSPFWHVDTLAFGQTLTAPPSDPHILKKKKKSLSATKWEENGKGGRGECAYRRENVRMKEKAVTGQQMTVREPIYWIISGGLSSLRNCSKGCCAHINPPCLHMREEGAMHVLISAAGGETTTRPGGYKQCCHVALGPSHRGRGDTLPRPC